MEWSETGIILAARPYGEGGAVLETFTRSRGRHAGFAHPKRTDRAFFQPGARVMLHWRGRLPEHLGRFRLEPLASNLAAILPCKGALAALSSLCALSVALLPERDPFPRLYTASLALLDALEDEAWQESYARWELLLLEALGYGLDLSRCAATGQRHDLCWVSPRSGRAVSRAGGRDYADRLLALPEFFLAPRRAQPQDARPGCEDLAKALALTGFFIERRVLSTHAGGAALPPARARLVRWCRRMAAAQRDMPHPVSSPRSHRPEGQEGARHKEANGARRDREAR